jgi:hypothetical protein
VRSWNLAISASITICAVVSLAGCGNGPQLAAPGSLPAQSQSRHRGLPRPACTPTLWAAGESATGAAVFGYTAANTTPCVTLNGMYNGLPFAATLSMATSSSPNPQYLYVADVDNSRIVVFDYQGNYVKWLDTTIGGIHYQPWGVCVSPSGTLGVGNRNGNVEFFSPSAGSGSTAASYATGVLADDEWCAFDSAGNFFVDGASGNHQKIAYLASSYVGMTGQQTLVDSGLGTSYFWVGMYSRIDSPADQTLSVATAVGHSATQTVYTWNVSGPATGPLTLTPSAGSPYTFTNYPNHPHHTRDPIYQVAPSAGGASGILYFADLGKKRVLTGAANGGSVAPYEHLNGAIGVALNPSGQY